VRALSRIAGGRAIMSINLKVYDNGDHTCLVWMPADGKPIAECRGFTIRRILDGKDSYLPGFTGFADDEKSDPAAPWKRPLQRYMWWDYGVRPGQVVQYSIVPVVRPTPGGDLQLSAGDASALTPAMTVTGQTSPHVSAYFNKGVVAAQWVTRVLDDIAAKQKLKPKQQPKLLDLIGNLKEPTATEPGNALRNALSGLLRPQLLKLLADVKQNGGEIYAALYELNDPELIAALKALGKKCHLLLANGAFAKKPHNDENYAVRQELRDVVDMHDRLVSGNHFAHNKFVVFCDANGKPTSVLSGSTNWAMTGLCTQANNAVIVDSPELAADFLNQWNLLKAACNDYPKSLGEANSKANTFSVDGASITQWFAPTAGGEDLIYARKLINEAKDGILFLFFNPGKFVEPGDSDEDWTLLQNIITRHHEDSPNYNPNLYVSGVVNQAIENLTNIGSAKSKGKAQEAAADPTAPAPVTLFSGGNAPPQRLGYESMVPKNIKDVFHDWQAETLGSGVHIHSKVVVIDPFGEKPVVMTGSHNLGHKASIANDDNLMIIEGNAAIAAAYAVNIIAIYQNFRWNAYVEAHRQDPHVFHNLQDNGDWQAGHLSGGALAELLFWLGTPGAAPSGAPAPGGGPASGGPPAKTVTAGPAPTPPKAKPVKKPKAPKKTAKKTAKKKSPKKKTPKKKTPAKKKKPVKKKNAAKKKKAPAKKKKSAKKKRAR
jgi:phosphatidylserine/phosphatidylglycerophosphate/cardiolipin synthase-like enzyme